MTKLSLYLAPISLVALVAAGAPASASIRVDGSLGDAAAAPAKSTDAPIILAQRGGGRGGGGRGGGGGMRGGGGGGMRAGGGGGMRAGGGGGMRAGGGGG